MGGGRHPQNEVRKIKDNPRVASSPFVGPIIFDWPRKGVLRPDRVI